MSKRTWVVAAGTAVTLVTASCAASSNERHAAEPRSDVTVIGFIETSTEPDGNPLEREVEVHVIHDQGRLRSMWFSSRIDSVLTEERFWDAARPGTITIRTWQDCQQTDDTMPAPLPESLEMVLEEYFGPRAVPPAHTTSADGNVTWEVKVDEMVTRRLIDNGTEYPASRTMQIEFDGILGITTTRGSLAETGDMPAWAPGWDSCKPADPM